jgi:hypothetical protein
LIAEPGIGEGELIKKCAFADAKSDAAKAVEMLLEYMT